LLAHKVVPRDFDGVGGLDALTAIAMTADARVKLHVDASGFTAWLDAVSVAQEAALQEQRRKQRVARRAQRTKK
jgi:hypothetical protein